MKTFKSLIFALEQQRLLIGSLYDSYKNKTKGTIYRNRQLSIVNKAIYLKGLVDNYNIQYIYTYSGTIAQICNSDIISKFEITLFSDSVEDSILLIEHLTKGKVISINQVKNRIGLLKYKNN